MRLLRIGELKSAANEGLPCNACVTKQREYAQNSIIERTYLNDSMTVLRARLLPAINRAREEMNINIGIAISNRFALERKSIIAGKICVHQELIGSSTRGVKPMRSEKRVYITPSVLKILLRRYLWRCLLWRGVRNSARASLKCL